jgi:hypothetical protein
MGETVFVDTGFFIAIVNKDDDFHNDALKIYAVLKKVLDRTRLVFTDYIFDEVITGLKSRKIPTEEISKFGDGLLQSKYYNIYPVSDPLFRSAWAMFKKYKDKEWSFTDCTSFAVMQELGIAFHLSFDEHFNQAKFQAWTGQ